MNQQGCEGHEDCSSLGDDQATCHDVAPPGEGYTCACSEDYEDLYGRCTYSGEESSLVVVATPRPVTAWFTDTLISIKVQFDMATNTPGDSDCFAILSNSTAGMLGSSPSCPWESSTTLVINLGSGPTIDLGDTIVFLDFVIFDLELMAAGDVGAVVVPDPPVNPPTISAVVTAPESIGVCDSLSLNGGTSTGNGGRAFIYSWSVEEADNAELSETELLSITDALASAGSVSSVTIPNEAFESGTSYTVRLGLENWLGDTAHIRINVTRLTNPAPTITLASSAVTVYTSDAVSLQASAGLPDTSCLVQSNASSVDSSYSISYAWVQTGGPVLDPLFTSSLALLYMDPYTLAPGEQYFFQCTATVTFGDGVTPDSWNTATVTVETSTQLPVAKLSPSDSTRSLSYETLSLSADGSFHPDFLDGNADGLSYSWACLVEATGEDCLQDNPNSPNMDFNTLVVDAATADVYIFTVTVTDSGGLSSSTSSRITFTEAECISISINAVSESLELYGKHNFLVTLTLEGIAEDYDYPEAIEWEWSSDTFDLTRTELLYTSRTSAALILAEDSLVMVRPLIHH